jgi:hypothetical protein
MLVALNPSSTLLNPLNLNHDQLRNLVIGFWAIVPPLFFWIDWVMFLPGEADREVAKHTHDLSRNIWLALVVTLALIFEVKLPGIN